MNQVPRIFHSTRIVGLCTGISRLLGFARMMLMANLFGTSLYVSAFFIAFQIPNMFRRLFGEGALSAAFVPVFTESLEKEGLEEANRLVGKVMTMLGAVLAVILLLGFIVIAIWMNFLSPGEKMVAVLPLMGIMLPYMFFICMVALFMGILNSRHHFFVPAATPMLLNIIWIGAMVLICPMFVDDAELQIRVVAWSVLASGVVQLLINLPMLLKHGIKLRLDFAWRDERVHKILLLMGPGALGMGVFQVNMLIGRFMAFAVADWAVSVLQYAELIIYLPLGIFATALGTVLLPTFSKQAARDEKAGMLRTLNASVRVLMLVMLPAAVGLGVLARPMVELFFEHGAFDAQATLYTARALWFLSPGLVVFSLYKVFVPAFYSRKDTKTPAVVSMIAVAVNFLLMVLFVIVWPEGYKHAGILFASVLSSALSCYVLAVLIHRQIGDPGWAMMFRSVGKSSVMSIAMGLIIVSLYQMLQKCEMLIFGSVQMNNLFRLIIVIFAGIAVYFGMAYIFCRRELDEIRVSNRH